MMRHLISEAKNNCPEYGYLHLVENFRTEKGLRQQRVLNIGASDVVTDQPQRTTKNSFKPGRKQVDQKSNHSQHININSLQTGEMRSWGPEYVYVSAATIDMESNGWGRLSLNFLYCSGDSLFGCKDALEPNLAGHEKSYLRFRNGCVFERARRRIQQRRTSNPNIDEQIGE